MWRENRIFDGRKGDKESDDVRVLSDLVLPNKERVSGLIERGGESFSGVLGRLRYRGETEHFVAQFKLKSL